MIIMQGIDQSDESAQVTIATRQGHGMDLFPTSNQQRQRDPSSSGGDVPYSGPQRAGRGGCPGAVGVLCNTVWVFTTRHRDTGPAEKGRVALRRRSTFS